VLDLDNTLWSGILGEDGFEGIQMSGDYPGKAFRIWQEGIKELQRSGVMMAICSKNNMADVEEVWKQRTDMLLQKSDFVAMRINWQDKASNLQELAQELNIGLDSFVFVDDNPTERELIKQHLPMVSVPDFPDHPYQLPNLYRVLVENYFSVYTLTDEDREKTKQYAANMQRKEAETSFANLDEFIASLDIRLTIQPVNDITLPRVAQMTQKTNQFNLTTHRYTEQDLCTMLADGAEIWTLAVADKFGDSGVTGTMIITKGGLIDTLLLSCRVLGKGIEEVFVKYVMEQTKHMELRANYIKTAKNSLVESFYDKMGFELFAEDGVIKQYRITLTNADLTFKQLYTIN
jgi:FkbH-like protein